jgi:hypothetical protein
MSQDWSRRQLLKQGGTAAAGVAGLGAVGAGVCGCGSKASAQRVSESTATGGVRTFESRPDLQPPLITLGSAVSAPSDPAFIMLATVASGPGQGGTMIMRTNGQLVWFKPDISASKMDFNTQTYQGKQVLTWWEGKVVAAGYGLGVGMIADASYQTVHKVSCANGLQADLHEFNITPQGTALLTAYKVSTADLSAVGGPSKAYLVSGVAQEIDIATGKLLFEWDSLDHVPIAESQQAYGTNNSASHPYDYFHINSLALDSDGDLLISARNTWTVYKVSRKTGQIVWRLGGKKSDFKVDSDATFHWQHHVRPHDGDTMTVFDNGAAPAEEKRSRALLLDVDEKKMQVSLRNQYVHPGKLLLSDAMGSAQLLPDGRMFVGWGTNPYFSEFSQDGKLLLDGRMTKGDPSFRAFLTDWDGAPVDKPAVAARPSSGGATVFASWNGATNVASWTVFAGKDATSLTPVGSVPYNDFETAMSVGSSGPWFAVQAHDAKGRPLSKSLPALMNNNPSKGKPAYGGCGGGNCGY